MVKTIIGVMGPGSNSSDQDLKNAYEIGKYIASKGYVTLTGGRDEGVWNKLCEFIEN